MMPPPLDRGSLIALGIPQPISDSSVPSSHELIVTTTEGVYSWDHYETVKIFSSRSKGIVAAKRVQANKEMMAVADSHLVILHDFEEGMQRTYRLRREDQGQIRMLYYDKRSQRLFFTTTLQNAVQSYSLLEARMLAPSPSHPSPPTVFAVSTTFDILLSASAQPPSILLTRIALNQFPMRLIPECSTAAVVAASFNPERGNIFALAFADGTVAAYNAATFRKNEGLEQQAVYSSNHGEIAHVKGLHTPTTVLSSGPQALPLADYGPNVGQVEIGESSASISAIVFLPGLPWTTASVGADGKCCIVRYQRDSSRATAQVVRTWHVHAPATSLAATLSQPFQMPQLDGSSDGGEAHTDGLILAIGREDGNVMIYNYRGELLAARDFGNSGQILDLEWLDNSQMRERTNGHERNRTRSTSASVYHTPPGSSRKRSDQEHSSLSGETRGQEANISPRSKIRVKLHVKNRPSDAEILESPRASVSHENGPNDTPTKDSETRSLSKGLFTNKKPESRRTSNIAHNPRKPSYASSKGSRKSLGHGIPVVPPRPTPRPGGKLAIRRSESRKKPKSRRPSQQAAGQRAAVAGLESLDLVPPSMPIQVESRTSSHSSQISPFSEIPQALGWPFSIQNPTKVKSNDTPELSIKPVQGSYAASFPHPDSKNIRQRSHPLVADYHTVLKEERRSSYTGKQADGPNSIPQAPLTVLVSPTRPPLRIPKVDISQVPWNKPNVATSASTLSSGGSFVDWSPPQAKNSPAIPRRPAGTPGRSVAPSTVLSPPKPHEIVDNSTLGSSAESQPHHAQARGRAPTKQTKVEGSLVAPRESSVSLQIAPDATGSINATSDGSFLKWRPQKWIKTPTMVDRKSTQLQGTGSVPYTAARQNSTAPGQSNGLIVTGPPDSGSSGSTLDWQPQPSGPQLSGPPRVNVIAASDTPSIPQLRPSTISHALRPNPVVQQEPHPEHHESVNEPLSISGPPETDEVNHLVGMMSTDQVAPSLADGALVSRADKGKGKAMNPPQEKPDVGLGPPPHDELYSGPPPPVPMHDPDQRPHMQPSSANPQMNHSAHIPPVSPSISTKSPRRSIAPTIRSSYQGWTSEMFGDHSQNYLGGDPSMFTLEEVIRLEFLDLRDHVNRAFEEQRVWLEKFVRSENWLVVKLGEENRKLREEMNRK